MDINEFKKHTKEIIFLATISYNYVERYVNREVLEFLSGLFRKEEEMKCFLAILRRWLIPSSSNKAILIIGGPSSGKDALLALISMAFECYSTNNLKFPSSFKNITKFSDQIELLHQRKRIYILQNPSLKELKDTVTDKLTCSDYDIPRVNLGDIHRTYLFSTHFLVGCKFLTDIKSRLDKEILKNIFIFNLPFTFVDDPKQVLEKPINYTLSQKILYEEKFKQGFITLLFEQTENIEYSSVIEQFRSNIILDFPDKANLLNIFDKSIVLSKNKKSILLPDEVFSKIIPEKLNIHKRNRLVHILRLFIKNKFNIEYKRVTCNKTMKRLRVWVGLELMGKND